jgi:hypothetical protein
MDTENLTPEQEQEILAHMPKEEDVRSKVVSEFGFDEETDKERIDKLVTDKMEANKRFQTAVAQKIKHRNDAEELRKKVTTPPPSEHKQEDIEKLVNSKLEQRDLDSLEYPDEIKKQIQRIATVDGISIKQASRDPMIVLRVEAWEKTQRADESAISRKNRSSGSQKFDINNPPEVDMRTEEGRKAFDEWKARGKKEGF